MSIVKLILLVALLFMPGLTWAKGQADVTNGVHNLSVSGVDPWDGGSQTPGSSLYATNTDKVCVFCHTPHGGSLTGPLWNRNNPNPAGWSHYNSASMSIDPGLPVNRPPNNESMLCLSCHDGSISVNHVVNPPNGLGGPIETWNGDQDTEIIDDIITGGPGKRIGGAIGNSMGTGILSDDHPISFSYNTVITSTDYTLGSKIGDLKPINIAEGNGVRFFTLDDNVECSSCHDPHVDYLTYPEYRPFLIISNAGSNLCLACHTK